MFEYKGSKIATKTLDRYDLTGILEACWTIGMTDIHDIRAAIKCKNNLLGDAIGALSINELIQYLYNKYNIKFEKKVSYDMMRPNFMKQ